MYRFMLNNSLAATSALIRNDHIYAADGKECNIHVFDLCGNFLNRECVTRAYSRLRYNESDCIFTALGCGCGNRIYYIDTSFNELGYTQLSTDCLQLRAVGALTDVSTANTSDGNFIVAAFERAVYLFGSDGKPIREICRADGCETITDFIVFGEEKYAIGTRSNRVSVVTVSDNGEKQIIIVDSRLSLRMLFASGLNVFGLFGHGYIYNRILPIYSNGSILRRLDF